MNDTEKTALEYLDDLPEPIRSQAIKEARKQDISTLFAPCYSTAAALPLAFLWTFSEQGWEYWQQVTHQLLIENLES